MNRTSPHTSFTSINTCQPCYPCRNAMNCRHARAGIQVLWLTLVGISLRARPPLLVWIRTWIRRYSTPLPSAMVEHEALVRPRARLRSAVTAAGGRAAVPGGNKSLTRLTWATKNESLERLSSISEMNASFESCNSRMRLGPSRFTWVTQVKT